MYSEKPIGNCDADRTKTRKHYKMECLNPKCKGEHPVRKCPDTSKEEASQLLKDFFEGRKNGKNEKKGKPRGYLGSLGGTLASSAMLRAAFCQGAVETVAKADQGSDCNLMPLSMLKNLKKSDPKGKVQELLKQQPYGTVIRGGQMVQCTQKVVSNIMLYIRHGTQLMLRSVEWMVCDCVTDFVIIGEPTLRALGMDNRALLEAACGKLGRDVDVPKLLEKLSLDNNSQNRTTGDIQSLMNAAKSQ